MHKHYYPSVTFLRFFFCFFYQFIECLNKLNTNMRGHFVEMNDWQIISTLLQQSDLDKISSKSPEKWAPAGRIVHEKFKRV